MAQKQTQKKKQPTKEEVSKKVKKLVALFNQLQEEYHEKSRKILFKIVDLRRIHDLDYSYDDLLEEEGLEEHTEKVGMFVKYRELEPVVVEQQERGVISNEQATYLANLPRKYLRPEVQKKIVEKIITKEIKTEDLRPSHPVKLAEVIDENPMEEQERMILHAVYQIEHIRKFLIEHEKEIIPALDKQKKEKIKESFFGLKNVIHFGLGIKVIKKGEDEEEDENNKT